MAETHYDDVLGDMATQRVKLDTLIWTLLGPAGARWRVCRSNRGVYPFFGYDPTRAMQWYPANAEWDPARELADSIHTRALR